MSQIAEFRVQFSTIPPVFFAGQKVTGVVVVGLNEKISLKAIKMRFKGLSKVHWIETRSEDRPYGGGSRDSFKWGPDLGRRSLTDHYRNGSVYFDETIKIFGNEPGSNEPQIELPVGTHSYPFEFQLPDKIPCSFEGIDYGYIRYSCKALIERSGKFDAESKAPFTVSTFCDLNKLPRALTPIQKRKHKYHCCLCCRTGPISLLLFIPNRRGFVCGEQIPVRAEIANFSEVVVKKWAVRLIQMVRYTGAGRRGTRTRETRLTLKEFTGTDIVPAGEETQVGCQLEIPPTPCTGLANCKFIVVEYKLKMALEIQRSTDLTASIEIIIGNVPVKSEWDNIVPPPSGPKDNKQSTATTATRNTMAVPTPGTAGAADPNRQSTATTGTTPAGMQRTTNADRGAPTDSSAAPGQKTQTTRASQARPTSLNKSGTSGNVSKNADEEESDEENADAASVSSLTAPLIPTPYPDMPPPLYAEGVSCAARVRKIYCVDDDDDEEDDDDIVFEDVYRPLYPTYKWR